MQVQIKKQTNAVHPNEALITIATVDGAEQLVVHRRSIEDDRLEIGYPISTDGDKYLIELPRETLSGLWRIWVPRGALFEERQYA